MDLGHIWWDGPTFNASYRTEAQFCLHRYLLAFRW